VKPRRRKPLTFYVDENLGRHVAAALAAEGWDVRPGHDHYAGVCDEVWLPAIGREGWVLLTKDKTIRRNTLEVSAILNSRVRAFVLTTTHLRREEQAALFLRAMPKIWRICAQGGPFIYNITRTGRLSRIPHRSLERRARGGASQ